MSLDALAGDALLDGEAVAFLGGKPSFPHVVQRVHRGAGPRQRKETQEAAHHWPITFVAFDLLRLDGLEVTALPWTHRREALEQIWVPGPARTLSPTHSDATSLWSATRAQGLEGVVSKRRSALYRPGARSPDWLKYPHRATESFVIGGWRPEVGSRRLGAVLVGSPAPDGSGRLRYRGRVGSGLAGRAGEALATAIAACPRAPCPFTTDVPATDARGTTWLPPTLVIDVRSMGPTAGGRLRQPSFARYRPDLLPDEVNSARA